MKRATKVTVRLDADLIRELDQMCQRVGQSRSAIVREVLKRHLAARRFEKLRLRAMPFAGARGYFTDEDVFKAIS